MEIRPLSEAARLEGIRERVIEPTPVKGSESPFQSLVKNVVASANDLQVDADRALEDFVRGEEQDIHRVMLAINKAELSFKFMMEVRNKMVEAYQEINRISV
jgi:flagellar hook-basal body complex protein FliE